MSRLAACRGIALPEGDLRKAGRLLARGGDHRLGEVHAHDLGAERVPRPRVDAAAAADIGNALACGIVDAPNGLRPTGIGVAADIGVPIALRMEVDGHALRFQMIASSAATKRSSSS